ncbi:uncharacterized protein BDR25DRAFT_338366 [Lindgomyces ingoldianus]|uniref:Uncharacterized protein n=1 Tax=Lindgomyces ingoldianus TaxID=673940 RepID=A0ACB6RFN5_9PLEO|nr:uncharacterized protein BDR25DRAFT_338366 [Lindgomyces ingoldianus]KAF2477535.1 hypothetical protein BDR25DRAFT_338366 [Lindgomyces ingoldianus]
MPRDVEDKQQDPATKTNETEPPSSRKSPKRLWDLPDEVLDKIFIRAGREGTCAYQIARGNTAVEQASLSECALCEPFTFWDWHGLSEEAWNSGYDTRKRQLYRGRQRCPEDKVKKKLSGRFTEGYPLGKQRWESFKRVFEQDPQNSWKVKRIAVSRWMTGQDLEWIATHLFILEALDLSDIAPHHESNLYDPDDPSRITRHPNWGYILRILRDTKARCQLNGDLKRFNPRLNTTKESLGLAERVSFEKKGLGKEAARKACKVIEKAEEEKQAYESEVCEKNLLQKLKWLGVHAWSQNLPIDWSGDLPESVATRILPACEILHTLSIRGEYTHDMNPDYCRDDVHGHVCNIVLGITDNVSDTVNTIELRQSLPFLDYFLGKIQERKPTITQVGIDLGAWIQIYPLRDERSSSTQPSPPLPPDLNIREKILAATEKARQDALEEAMEPFSPLRENVDDHIWKELALNNREVTRVEPWRRRGEADFYRSNSGSEFVGLPSHSLPKPPRKDCLLDQDPNHKKTREDLGNSRIITLAQMLRTLQYAGEQSKIKLIPIEPESQNKSINPIHPLALIQLTSEVLNEGAYRDADFDLNKFTPLADLQDVYRWLDETFKWRPVFDWDWFMVPTVMEKSLEPEYELVYEKDKFHEVSYLARIREHFQLLQEAKIPVHVLIGRRQPNFPSLYWGSQCSIDKWKAWLNEPFNANLGEIADLLDCLSILYDLRNPLSLERLEEINLVDPYKWPSETCPVKLWPYKLPEGEDAAPSESLFKTCGKAPIQKMANKHAPKSKRPRSELSEGLANACVSAPPVGENANDHSSDDSNFSEPNKLQQKKQSLHHCARRAAYMREAVGWQRFWAKYALKFTRLYMLRVRMPRCFDRVGSWRLARLLKQEMGWKMITYTDERQHMQTEEDLLPYNQTASKYSQEVMMFPAGRLVRRSWICPEPRKPVPGTADFATAQRRYEEWRNRKFTDEDFTETLKKEEQELDHATAKARDAATREFDTERSRLQEAEVRQRIDRWAQQHWREYLLNYIKEIRDEETKNQARLNCMSKPRGEVERIQRDIILGRRMAALLGKLREQDNPMTRVKEQPVESQSEGTPVELTGSVTAAPVDRRVPRSEPPVDDLDSDDHADLYEDGDRPKTALSPSIRLSSASGPLPRSAATPKPPTSQAGSDGGSLVSTSAHGPLLVATTGPEMGRPAPVNPFSRHSAVGDLFDDLGGVLSVKLPGSSETRKRDAIDQDRTGSPTKKSNTDEISGESLTEIPVTDTEVAGVGAGPLLLTPVPLLEDAPPAASSGTLSAELTSTAATPEAAKVKQNGKKSSKESKESETPKPAKEATAPIVLPEPTGTRGVAKSAPKNAAEELVATRHPAGMPAPTRPAAPSDFLRPADLVDPTDLAGPEIETKKGKEANMATEKATKKAPKRRRNGRPKDNEVYKDDTATEEEEDDNIDTKPPATKKPKQDSDGGYVDEKNCLVPPDDDDGDFGKRKKNAVKKRNGAKGRGGGGDRKKKGRDGDDGLGAVSARAITGATTGTIGTKNSSTSTPKKAATPRSKGGVKKKAALEPAEACPARATRSNNPILMSGL